MADKLAFCVVGLLGGIAIGVILPHMLPPPKAAQQMRCAELYEWARDGEIPEDVMVYDGMDGVYMALRAECMHSLTASPSGQGGE